MDLVLSLNLEPMHLVAWQAFWVGLFCRMLHTLATGAVWSKKASMAWAQGALDPQWRGLIARAAAVRKGDEVAGRRARRSGRGRGHARLRRLRRGLRRHAAAQPA